MAKKDLIQHHVVPNLSDFSVCELQKGC